MIRIGFVIDEIRGLTAGTEQQLMRLVQGLRDRGFSVHLIALRRSAWSEEVSSQLSIDFLDVQSLRKPSSAGGIRKLESLVDRYDLQIVHSFYFDSTVITALASLRRKGVAHATARRGFINSERPARLRRLLLRTLRNRYDACVCNSKALAEYVHSSERIPRERIRVIYNGLRLPHEPRNTTVPQTLNSRLRAISQAGPVICTIANLRAVKNLDFLQHAAKAVISWNPTIQFIVVGDGEERTRLETNARRIGIDHNFHLLGALSDPGPVLDIGTMTVQTSKSESLSNALIESSAAGLPVIASDVGGNSEAINNDVTGFLYEPGDLEQLVSRIKGLIQNEELRQKMGAAGEIFVEKKFAGTRYIEEHARLYEELTFMTRAARRENKAARKVRTLLVTYKTCFQVDGKNYTTGGSAKEFGALAEFLDLSVLASIHSAKVQGTGWEEIDERVRCFSLGPVRSRLAFPPPLLAVIRATREARRLVRDREIELVILKGPSEVTMAPILALRPLKIPLLYYYSLDWVEDLEVSRRKTFTRRLLSPYFLFVQWYRSNLDRATLRAVDAVGVLSTSYREKLSRIRPRAIYLLPEAFTISASQIKPSSAILKKAEGRFLFVGRIDRNKNVQLILQALSILERKVPNMKLELDVVGDGDEFPRLVSMARDLGVEDRVRFHGYVSNDKLRPFYEGATALILPSFTETLGQVVMEAFSVGTPVIGSNVGGIPDLVEEGRTGYLIDPHNVDSLADKMVQFSRQVGDYEEMQRHCLQKARQYTREKTAVVWRNALLNLLEVNAGS